MQRRLLMEDGLEGGGGHVVDSLLSSEDYSARGLQVGCSVMWFFPWGFPHYET